MSDEVENVGAATVDVRSELLLGLLTFIRSHQTSKTQKINIQAKSLIIPFKFAQICRMHKYMK